MTEQNERAEEIGCSLDPKIVVDTMARECNELVGLEKVIKRDPRAISTMNFNLCEKGMICNFSEKDAADKELVARYYHYVKKINDYNRLFNQIKDFIKQFDCNMFIEFELDKENYPTAAIGHYNLSDGAHKVYLLKPTYKEPDYIEYKYDIFGSCTITKIFSQQPPIGHKSFMLEMLIQTVEKYNNLIIREKYDSVSGHKTIISKLIVDLKGNSEEERQRYHNFFRKKGFVFTETGIYKFI